MSRRGKTSEPKEPKKVKRVQTRHVAFTLNNYTDEEIEQIRGLHPNYVSYVCFGYEVAPDTGTPHLQGYMRFASPNATDWESIKNWPGCARMHYEKCGGNPEQNRVYCAKGEQSKAEYETYHPRKGNGEGLKPWDARDATWNHGPNYGLNVKFEEIGNWVSKQGDRTDIKELLDVVRGDPDYKSLVDNVDLMATYVKFHGGIDKARFLYLKAQTPKHERPAVFWLYGPTGKGKTMGVKMFTEMYLGLDTTYDLWISAEQNGKVIFDNYVNQTVALFDEFKPGVMAFKTLLGVLDFDGRTVNVKNATASFRPKVIFIATSRSISELYEYRLSFEDGSVDQLRRRVDTQIECGIDQFATYGSIIDAYHTYLDTGVRKPKDTLDRYRKLTELRKAKREFALHPIRAKPPLTRQAAEYPLEAFAEQRAILLSKASDAVPKVGDNSSDIVADIAI